MMEFLEWTFYGNSTRGWAIALLTATAIYLILWGVRALLLRSLEHLATRTTSEADDIAVEAVRAIRRWFVGAVAVWAGAIPLSLPERAGESLQLAVVLLLLLQMGICGASAIRAHVHGYTARRINEDASAVTTMRAIGFLGTVALWAILALMALDNLGIEITALVAGLGIGGVAVALAVQNILGDLFASLSIVLDKPFVYGDFIVVGELAGTVEHIGVKTTRLKSLSGEQLVFSNSDLLQSRIRNFRRMEERRISFAFGVIYQTSPADLARIPGLVREVIEAQPTVRFDRAHFKSFGESSLDFEVIYFVLDPEFKVYMDSQQAINLELFARFEREKIEFAYPTRTLYMSGTGEAVAPGKSAP
jgi:small-conductance mechanosensitive channel